MITIFLVDDQRLILEAIKAVLKDEPEMEIVGMAQDGRSALAQITKLQPDIVLIDIEMPKMNGIVTTGYISQYFPDTKVIVLSGHNSKGYITKALQAGASGYLVKDSLIKDLKQAIYSLSRGYSYIETQLLTKAVNQIQASNTVNKKSTYIRKYRKNIYSPSVAVSYLESEGNEAPDNIQPSWQQNYEGISKATLAPIFELLNSKPIGTADYAVKASLAAKHNQHSRRFWKQIGLCLVAIASLILSVVIF